VSLDRAPVERPAIVVPSNKNDFLKQALGAIGREMRLKGLEMKYGTRPLKEAPEPPTGKATHKGDLY